jgi:hypothetical protein
MKMKTKALPITILISVIIVSMSIVMGSYINRYTVVDVSLSSNVSIIIKYNKWSGDSWRYQQGEWIKIGE